MSITNNQPLIINTVQKRHCKMRVIVAYITVISGLFVVAHSIDFSFNCAARGLDLASCIARQVAEISWNVLQSLWYSLVSYQQDCLNGAGVGTTQASKEIYSAIQI